MNPGHSGEVLIPSTFENHMSSPGNSPVFSGEADGPAGSSPSPSEGQEKQTGRLLLGDR